MGLVTVSRDTWVPGASARRANQAVYTWVPAGRQRASRCAVDGVNATAINVCATSLSLARSTAASANVMTSPVPDTKASFVQVGGWINSFTELSCSWVWILRMKELLHLCCCAYIVVGGGIAVGEFPSAWVLNSVWTQNDIKHQKFLNLFPVCSDMQGECSAMNPCMRWVWILGIRINFWQELACGRSCEPIPSNCLSDCVKIPLSVPPTWRCDTLFVTTLSKYSDWQI